MALERRWYTAGSNPSLWHSARHRGTYGLLFGMDRTEEGLLDDVEIERRVEGAAAPTCTACYFELGGRLTEILGERGRMLRCADDFEEPIHRFWLENALWFGRAEAQKWTPEMAAYAAHAVANR